MDTSDVVGLLEFTVEVGGDFSTTEDGEDSSRANGVGGVEGGEGLRLTELDN